MGCSPHGPISRSKCRLATTRKTKDKQRKRSEENLVAGGPVARGGAPEKITLTPYGCAKFRISMFPITERAGKAFRWRSEVSLREDERMNTVAHGFLAETRYVRLPPAA
jgi:hypothetical protein